MIILRLTESSKTMNRPNEPGPAKKRKEIRRTTARETAVSRHHGDVIDDPPPHEAPRASHDSRIERFN